jgi:hypothetical protein
MPLLPPQCQSLVACLESVFRRAHLLLAPGVILESATLMEFLS